MPGLNTLPGRITINTIQLGETAYQLLLLFHSGTSLSQAPEKISDGVIMIQRMKDKWSPGQSLSHFLNSSLSLTEIEVEQRLFTVSIKCAGPLVFLAHSVVVFTCKMSPYRGWQVKEELEPVQHSQGVPGLVCLVLPAENVEEHLVRLFLAS